MRNFWESPAIFFNQKKVMQKSWESHEKVKQNSWEYHEKVRRESGERHEKAGMSKYLKMGSKKYLNILRRKKTLIEWISDYIQKIENFTNEY